MSRGFVKDGDQEEIPFVPPRAYLPPGVPNYVTPAGFEELLAEKQALIHEKEQSQSDNENDHRVSVNFINSKLELLDERIYSARIIKPEEQPQNEIRFGATVELLSADSNQRQTFQLTGVDEADASQGKISFVSPLAKALSNKKVGDKVLFKRAKDEVVYIIEKVSYL